MTKKIISVVLICILIATCISMLCSCVDSTMNVSISKDNLGVNISEDLYGVFLEDISYACDGGLVSNLIANNSFEYEYNNTSNWVFNNLSTNIEKENGLNEVNKTYLDISVVDSGSAKNLGYVEYYKDLSENYNEDLMQVADMGFKTNNDYVFSCYIKNIDYVGTITISLDSMVNSSLDFSKSQISAPAVGSEWEKIEVTLSSGATEDGGVQITFDGNGELYLDFCSLVSTSSYGYTSDEWKYVSLRPDLYQALSDLNPSFIRFPGGCLAEGDSLDSLYSWKNTIGPLESRLQSYNLWNDDENGKTYNNTNAMGYHEYFQLSEDLGAKALPILNVGMICEFEADYNKNAKAYKQGRMTDEEWEEYLDTIALRPGTEAFENYLQDILDLIEYANGDISTEWGAKRAENGHIDSFDLKYIGLGNENWGEIYWRNFDALYNAIKEIYPDLTIISSAGYWFEDDQKDEAWEIINEKYSDTLVDEHYYTSNNLLFKNNDMYDEYDRDGAKVFVGEYAATCQLFGKYITKNNLWSAIEEASYMTGLERNGDIVSMASYAPTFAKVNAQCWDENMIWFDSQNLVLTPNYYNQMLFSNNVGNQIINVDSKNYGCYSTTTINQSEQVIYYKIINTNQDSITIDLDVNGFGNINGASMQYLSDESKAACNEIGSTTIIPKQVECQVSGNSVLANIDGYSINIIRVYYGDNDGSSLFVLPEIINTMEQNVTKYSEFYMTLESVIALSVIAALILFGAPGLIFAMRLYRKKKKPQNEKKYKIIINDIDTKN